MILLCIENPKKFRKILQLISSESLPDVRSIYNYELNSYTLASEQYQNEINKTIPFIITPKGIKFLRRNLAKEVQELYIENYKT